MRQIRELVKQESPFLLHTTVLTDVSRFREAAAFWHQDTVRQSTRARLSAVTIAELVTRLRPTLRIDSQNFIDELSHLGVTREIAKQPGVLRNVLTRQGRAIQTADALVAAPASMDGVTLVTANVKDFPMPRWRLLQFGS